VVAKDGKLIITNSKGNSDLIDKEHWQKVMVRLESLPDQERGMTGRYALGKKDYSWNKAPNQIFSPYVPAIVKYLNEKGK